MPIPRKTTILSFVGFVAVLSLAIIFRPQNVNVVQKKPVREFGEGDYGDVLGIDLGRTYSRVGIFRNDTFEIIADELGRDVVPSYVAFPYYGPPLVGFAAMDQAVKNPKNTIYDARLLLGRSFSDPELQKVIERLAYDVVDRNGKPLIHMRIKGADTYIHPEEIFANIFDKLKDMAKEHLNRTVEHAIVAVPSHFNDAQRQATKDAATMAGLNVLRIVNEPTAAGIAYGLEILSNEELNYVIYNLGAKESHLALESVELGVYEILAQEVDASLGGEGFENMQTLSHEYKDRILGLIKKLLEDAKMEKEDVDGILLIGDPSHIAKLQLLVEDFFDGMKTLSSGDVSPDQAVVHGAAIQGHVLSHYDDICPPMLDVTPLSLGIETSGGIFTKIVSRNTVIPTRKTRNFSTAMDNQEKIVIKILEGERAISNKNRLLGTLELTGLSPRPRGIPDIEVMFEIDPDEIITVIVRDKESAKEEKLVISGHRGRYSQEEIDEIVIESDNHWEEDQLVWKGLPDEVQDGSEEGMFGIITR